MLYHIRGETRYRIYNSEIEADSEEDAKSKFFKQRNTKESFYQKLTVKPLKKT